MQAGQTLCERTGWLTQRRQLTGRGGGVPATGAGLGGVEGFATGPGGGGAGLGAAGFGTGAEGIEAAATAGAARTGATGGGTGTAAGAAAGAATGPFPPAASATRGASAARNVAPHRHFTRSLGCAALSSGTGMLRPQPTQRTVICARF
jgi:hypothetical protein